MCLQELVILQLQSTKVLQSNANIFRTSTLPNALDRQVRRGAQINPQTHMQTRIPQMLAENECGAMDAPLHQLHLSQDNELMSLSLCHQDIRLEVMGPRLRVPVEESEKIAVTLTTGHSLPLD
jgi:hypothetical protein